MFSYFILKVSATHFGLREEMLEVYKSKSNIREYKGKWQGARVCSTMFILSDDDVFCAFLIKEIARSSTIRIRRRTLIRALNFRNENKLEMIRAGVLDSGWQ